MREEWKIARRAREAAGEALESKKKKAEELAAKRDLLVGRHGDGAKRSMDLDAARLDEKKACEELAATSAQLGALRPETLENELRRLERAIAGLEGKRLDAEKRAPPPRPCSPKTARATPPPTC